MKTLIIYDNKGSIFSQMSGNYLVPQGGIQFLEIEIPEGKQLNRVDVSVTPHQAILEDIPLSEIEQLKQTIADLTEVVLMGGM